MTLDEAIKERQKVIEVQEKLYEDASTNESKEIIKSATDNDRQLVEWLIELKDLREDNKVLTSECDRLIKEKGELNELKEKAVLDICWREARLKDAKRLLQLAWDDIQTLNDATVDDEGNCLIEDKFESCTECPLFCESKRYCGWRYQVDALKLIGDERNEP